MIEIKLKIVDNALRKAVRLWGRQAQIDMAIEEMSELIQALQKLKRVRGKTYTQKRDNVREEIADVLLMTLQLRHMFGEEQVDSWGMMKVERLYERFEESVS